MAVSLSITIAENSQSTANNKTNITVKVIAKWTYGSFNRNDPSGSCTIDGTKYNFTSDFNSNQTTSGSQTIFTKTLDIKHDDEGKKKLSVSATFATGVSSGTISASASKQLTDIPRKSTLTVENGTLGTPQTLKITEKASSFVHKLKYVCGDASGWILGSSTETSTALSKEWEPPVTLAKQNTTGTSVSITFTLYTYTKDGDSVGSNSYTKTFAIPTNIKPSVSIEVSDPKGYAATYGGYIQGMSAMKIVASGSGNQGSTIKSYKVEADGKTYTTATTTTGVVSGTGDLTIKVTVTDSRGRTNTATATITALAYSAPKISAMSVYRCTASGAASAAGAYLAVKFSATIKALNSKNSAAFTIKYKKSTDTEYTTKTLTDFAGKYSVSNGIYVFAADTASSYDITLTAKDDFKSASRSATGPSIKKLWSLLKKAGKVVGIAIGKMAELEDTIDIAMPVKLREGIIQNLLWSGALYMSSGHTVTLNEPVSKQPSGIVLVFSLYDGEAKNQEFFEFFVPKYTINAHSACGRNFNLCGAFRNGVKYLYLYDDKITGNDKNATTLTIGGITYDNSKYVLRYVIGV